MHGKSIWGSALKIKMLVTALAVSGTAAVAGLGTYGTFTSSTAAQTVTDSSGTVILDFGSAGTTNRLAVGALNLAAGDTMQRGFTLRNSGTLDSASISMAISDRSPSLLDSTAGAANGMTVEIDKCSTGFTESKSTPYTYSCSGTKSVVLASTPVANVESDGASGVSLPNLSALGVGGSDSLLAAFSLPSTAGNSYEGLSATLSIGFTATQRTATAQ